MKKFLITICALMLVLSLAACGGKDKNSASSKEDTPLVREDSKASSSVASASGKKDADVASIRSNPSAFNKSSLSKEQLDALEKDAKENGYTYSWDDKGNLVIKEPNGKTIAWGSKWEKNEFTEQVPALDESFIVASSMAEKGYSSMLSWTLKDAQEYGEKIKNAGFTQNVTSVDTDTMYTYIGGNDKYMVTVTWGKGNGTNGALNITRK